ncbi:cupin domain-containing protein [Asanoa sp. WMMD1127]|uniref:cupin domain-containing protein n=1 Tax=Asanoa sp. WMMD1127 TaxID=3016107 RepID=UPI00241725D8|nr:cupin domain-containing protein [Asanoa sp. WMMD1127]MDG4827309.1 cupin domain-containing protein [Asanoa sp. WMMD1127]
MTNAESHFGGAGGTPTAAGRFVDPSTIKPHEILPGLAFQPVLGEKSLLNVVRFDAHAEAPVHQHEEEQVVLVIEGEIEFEIDGETRTLKPGDVAVIPSWVPHGARTTGTPCVEVDFFTPPRATLLDQARAALHEGDA